MLLSRAVVNLLSLLPLLCYQPECAAILESAVVLTDKGSINSAGTGEGMKHCKETKRACLADAAGSLTCQPPNSAAFIKVDSSVLESYTPSIASRKQI